MSGSRGIPSTSTVLSTFHRGRSMRESNDSLEFPALKQPEYECAVEDVTGTSRIEHVHFEGV